MRIAIVGAGLVGQRTARMLASSGFDDVVLISQSRPIEPLEGVLVGQGWPHPAARDADIVVLATESSRQPSMAARLVKAGTHVVSTADNLADVERLLALHETAVAANAILVVGASYSPGLSSLLAAHLASSMDHVDTISTAQFGTGGPACARQHHRALASEGTEVHQAQLRTARRGSGRELVWFPNPVGPADCYRAGLADPLLLHRAFPTVRRIESRQAATRRDRLTARLPMLRPPHEEGLTGAVWVEVRGLVDGQIEHRAMAATAPHATGAAAMAAAFSHELAAELRASVVDDAPSEPWSVGVNSAADYGTIVPLMGLMSQKVRLWTYDGSQIDPTSGQERKIHAARKWGLTT